MKMIISVLFALSLLFNFINSPEVVYATLLTGSIDGIPESQNYTWGYEGNNLTAEWSIRSVTGHQGWFYGSDHRGAAPNLNYVDFYIAKGITDPTSIVDASVFTYVRGSMVAEAGDTVFFRGTKGYYGAWRIDDIYSIPGATGSPLAKLDGQWYFQSDGTPNFSSVPTAGGYFITAPAIVPIPGAVWLLGTGLLGLAGWRRFRKG